MFRPVGSSLSGILVVGPAGFVVPVPVPFGPMFNTSRWRRRCRRLTDRLRFHRAWEVLLFAWYGVPCGQNHTVEQGHNQGADLVCLSFPWCPVFAHLEQGPGRSVWYRPVRRFKGVVVAPTRRSGDEWESPQSTTEAIASVDNRSVEPASTSSSIILLHGRVQHGRMSCKSRRCIDRRCIRSRLHVCLVGVESLPIASPRLPTCGPDRRLRKQNVPRCRCN